MTGASFQMLLTKGGGPAALTFITTVSDATDLTTYSFAGASIGTADSTRRVVCVVHWMYAGAGTDTVLNSATIGGVAATIHVQTNNGVTASPGGCAIISALVPTGTTGTIAATFNALCSRCLVGIYRAVNEGSATPVATASDNTLTSSTTLDVNVNISAGGWAVAGVTTLTSAATPTNTWTGVTEQYDVTLEATSRGMGGGFVSASAGGTPVTINVVASTALVNGAACSMSWL